MFSKEIQNIIDTAKEQALHFQNEIFIDKACGLLRDKAILTQTQCTVSFNQQSVCYSKKLLNEAIIGHQTEEEVAWKLKSVQVALQNSLDDCIARANK